MSLDHKREDPGLREDRLRHEGARCGLGAVKFPERRRLESVGWMSHVERRMQLSNQTFASQVF